MTDSQDAASKTNTDDDGNKQDQSSDKSTLLTDDKSDDKKDDKSDDKKDDKSDDKKDDKSDDKKDDKSDDGKDTKSDDDKSSDDKKVDKKDDKKDDDAPEKYEDFTLPEGVELTEESRDAFNALAKTDNLSQETAQKYVDLAVKNYTEQFEQQVTAWDELNQKWVGEIKADKEFGGAKMDETVASSQRAMKRFDPDGELKAALDGPITGNHPALIKLLTRVDKAIREDKIVDGGASEDEPQSPAEVMYGKTKK